VSGGGVWILALMTFLFLFFGYLGVPVAFSLTAGVLVGAMFTDVSLTAMIQKMFDGMDSEALLAIPFFLLVGELMSSANVVQRVANLSLALVGHIRGGLSQTVTVFSMFFSEMSGSTTADVAVISRALGGPMKKEGYSPAFTAAIIAAASTIAALVPPSITAVVYGAVGNVSIAGLFMAGVVPGLIIGFGLMLYCYFFGPRGMQRPRATFGQITRAFGDASLPLMIPVILLGGILSGWFTPTEAGVVAVAWILAVVIPTLNPGHLRQLPYDFCLAGLIFSLPLITIGAANAFGWLFAYLRGAIVIAEWLTALAGNDPHLIMLLLVLLFTVIGDFIEPVPTIIIFMPLVNALTASADINAVHMGVVLIATLAFGLITPPYGLVLLMASKFIGVRFSQALRAALPIYVVFLATITFCIYFPKVVLWLPKQVIPESVGCFKNPSGAGYICPN
jgi:C4-dicarboxylate transporter, DctM subunit